MSKKLTDKDFWNWFQKGVDNGFITESFCMTHDGGYEHMTDEERQEWEDGGDPCMTVARVVYLG